MHEHNVLLDRIYQNIENENESQLNFNSEWTYMLILVNTSH